MMTVKAYLSGIIALFALAVGAYLVLAEHERDVTASHADSIKERLANDIEAILRQYVGRVNLLAADPNLGELIDFPSSREMRQDDLARMIDAEQVMLFGRGEEKSLAGDYPLLSFSELDLIYQAENGQQPRIEYHKLQDGGSHLDIVRPFKRGDEVIGFVLVRFADAPLLASIKRLAVPNGRMELSQILSDNRLESFVSWGDEAAKSKMEALNVTFVDAAWRLSYWELPIGPEIMNLDWRIFFWLTFFEIIAVLALMMTVFRRMMDKAMISSANVLFGYVRDRLSGQWMGKIYSTHLRELQPTLNNLENLTWNVQSQAEQEVAPVEAEAPKKSAAEASEKGRKEFERSYVDIMYQGKNIEIDGEEESSARQQAMEEAQPPSTKLTDKAEKAEVSRVLASLAATLKDDASVDLDVDAVTETDAVMADESIVDVMKDVELQKSIFRAYDIRGVVGETLSVDVAYEIGRAFGTEAWEKGEQVIVVGRDGRQSSAPLSEALVRGLCESGRDVIDLGEVPTPLVYFATHYLNARSAVMVTGSHNPVEYNGFKLVLQGEALSERDVYQIYERIQSGDFTVGSGSYSEQNLSTDYSARIQADVQFKRNLKVVVDCGNGVASELAPPLLRSLGCEVIELYCEVDGSFPYHHPDPSQPVNLQALIGEVKQHQADVGLAFDGDGDRLGAVDSQGNIVWPDKQLMLFAKHVLAKNPGGQVLYDVKCSRHLHRLIESFDGKPLMWKSGHSLMKAKIKETGAVLAGELSGHVFFNDRWYGFDDALYTAVRLLEILANDEKTSSEVFAEFPDALSTPEIPVKMKEGEHIKLIDELKQKIELPDAQLITIDGVRAEFKQGWGLVRASNTSPSLIFRFEAQNEQTLDHIKALFKVQVQRLAPDLKLPF